MVTATRKRPRKKKANRKFPTLSLPSPLESAREAGLRYVSDEMPGIRRAQAGKGFRYRDHEGRPIGNRETLRRIRSLVIPPAWAEVWICPLDHGHLQATGRDARGRKQYRYHRRWQAVRDGTKYEKLIHFGQSLPEIRKRVNEDLSRPGLPKEKVLATVVRFLETTLIRVGNEEYAKANGSYGLTTLRNQHARVNGSTVSFSFRGKSGVRHAIDVRDPRLARIVQKLQDLPGQELFQHLDEEGNAHSIGSAEVNEYLREISGQDFTAKDFRTWAGTVLAARALQEFEAFDSQARAKKNVVQAIEEVAKRLGNTRTVCRKCYVHPSILTSYLDGTLRETLSQKVEKELKENLSALPPEEAVVLAFLQEVLKTGAASGS